MVVLKGFRYVMLITALVGGIGATLYPIVIKPLFSADEYKQMRKAHPFKAREQ